MHEANDAAQPVRFIFSGDTVMDSNYWRPGHLLRSWFRTAGSIKAQAPDTDLYWLLLVKGHRTYRIMADFFRHYALRQKQANDPALIRLRDQFSRTKYGDYFDPSTGLTEVNRLEEKEVSDLADRLEELAIRLLATV